MIQLAVVPNPRLSRREMEMGQSIGSLLRETRKRRHKTLQDVATAVGVSPTYVSMVESKGYVKCSKKFLLGVAEYLEMDVDSLLLSSRMLPDDVEAFLFEMDGALKEVRKLIKRRRLRALDG